MYRRLQRAALLSNVISPTLNSGFTATCNHTTYIGHGEGQALALPPPYNNCRSFLFAAPRCRQIIYPVRPLHLSLGLILSKRLYGRAFSVSPPWRGRANSFCSAWVGLGRPGHQDRGVAGTAGTAGLSGVVYRVCCNKVKVTPFAYAPGGGGFKRRAVRSAAPPLQRSAGPRPGSAPGQGRAPRCALGRTGAARGATAPGAAQLARVYRGGLADVVSGKARPPELPPRSVFNLSARRGLPAM